MRVFSKTKKEDKKAKKKKEKAEKLKFEDKKAKKKAEKREKLKIPKTAQQTIPFKEIYDNGIIKVEEDYYSIIIKFGNINYMLAREDEKEQKFNLYKQVVNSIDPSFHYQELLMNEAIDEEQYRKALLPKKPIVNEISKDYVKVQEHFIRESYNATADTHTYVVLGYRVKSKNEDIERTLKKAYRDVSLSFKKLGSTCELMTNVEKILEIFYKYYNPIKSRDEKFLLPKNIYSKGMKIKDYIAPSSFKFNKDHIEMGMAYNRVFYIRDFPSMLEDKFFSDLLDNSYAICITKHLDHIDKGAGLKFLNRHLTGLEQQRQEKNKKNAREGMTFINPELKKNIEETEKMIETLNNDQSLFSLAVYISVSADTKEDLDEISSWINTQCLKHQVRLDVVTHRQEKALASMLPLAMDKAQIKSKRPTDDVSILLPFNAQNIFNENGFYYGRNSLTNSMVIIDRKQLKNGNGFVLGVPGSGKSFKEKREIIDALEQTDDDVIIIDPEREFGGLAQKYNGEVIKVSASTNTHLNPFDITKDYADEDDPIQMKSDFIMSLVETLKGELSPVEKTIVDRCVRLAYKDFINNDWDKEYLPTLTSFYEIVKVQEEKEAKDIALALELYAIGSLSTFSNKSNVTLTNKLTVFDTRDLGKQLKKVGLLIVLDYVWNILCENKAKGKNTWIITDEFYLYFDDKDGKDSYSADYYYMIYKRSRKYGGMVTGITQNVEDLLQSPKARTMLANSQFLILLDQAPTDRAVLKDLLKLSEGQESFITNAEKGCGLLICGKDIIPIEDTFPKDNLIYKTITTNLQEIREYMKEDKAKESKVG